jgi:hypothetical protein
MTKYLSLAGVLAAPWWLITVGVFGYLEPDYSHYYKAVSELGAFGASNWIAMNIICQFTTGALVVISGISFRQLSVLTGVSKNASFWLIITGVMLAGAAVPADMELYFKSPWTIAHAFFVMLGVIPFFITAWKTPEVLSLSGVNSKFINYFPLAIIPAFSLHAFVEQGGLVQRLTILIVLAWVSYLSWVLFKIEKSHNNKLKQDGASAAV